MSSQNPEAAPPHSSVRPVPGEAGHFAAQAGQAAAQNGQHMVIATATVWQLRPSSQPRYGRLAIALVLSILFHAALLGLTLLPTAPARVQLDSLEVALVNTRSETAPLRADILAQQALEGGGEQAQGVSSSPLPRTSAHSANELFMTALHRRQHELEQEQQKLLVQLQAQRDALQAHQLSRNGAEPAPDTDEHDITLRLDLLNAEIATLNKRIEHYNAHPRRHFVGPSAQESAYANYLDAWRQQIETVGTEHYPPEARGKLYGQLQLTVYINTDGSLDHIEIHQPSEHAILNLAAQRIVQLAAPFPPLPDAIRRDTDILAITRTWHFTNQQLYIQAP